MNIWITGIMVLKRRGDAMERTIVVTDASFYRVFTKFCRFCKEDRVEFHDLRYTCTNKHNHGDDIFGLGPACCLQYCPFVMKLSS